MRENHLGWYEYVQRRRIYIVDRRDEASAISDMMGDGKRLIRYY